MEMLANAGREGLAVREVEQQLANQMDSCSSWTAGDDRSRTGTTLAVISSHRVPLRIIAFSVARDVALTSHSAIYTVLYMSP